MWTFLHNAIIWWCIVTTIAPLLVQYVTLFLSILLTPLDCVVHRQMMGQGPGNRPKPVAWAEAHYFPMNDAVLWGNWFIVLTHHTLTINDSNHLDPVRRADMTVRSCTQITSTENAKECMSEIGPHQQLFVCTLAGHIYDGSTWVWLTFVNNTSDSWLCRLIDPWVASFSGGLEYLVRCIWAALTYCSVE